MKPASSDVVGYHAHVYYDPESRERAARVRDALAIVEGLVETLLTLASAPSPTRSAPSASTPARRRRSS